MRARGGRRGRVRTGEEVWVLIELGLEDRLDALARRGAEGQRPAAGGLQALLAVGLGEVQQAQARAVALLGMRPVVELPLHYCAGAGADLLCPVQEPARRPLQVPTVRLWHVLGERGVCTAL